MARQLGRPGPLKLLEAAVGASAPGGSKGGGGGRTKPIPAFMRSPDGGGRDAEREEAGSRGESEGGGVGTGVGRWRRGGSIFSGDRWVVMNESGCMLERASGKVRRAARGACVSVWVCVDVCGCVRMCACMFGGSGVEEGVEGKRG